MEPTNVKLAREAYARYAQVTDNKNFQGNPMPEFDALPEKIQEAWCAAVQPMVTEPKYVMGIDYAEGVIKRDVLDHRVEGKGGGADDTRVVVLDDPGQGGACHKYAVLTGAGLPLLTVDFQNGPIQEVGLNGVQQEHLAATIIDRLRCFQAGPFSSRYNAIALTKFEEGLMWLQRRTVDRVRRGVEGFNKA
jgi:hypothetical protein